MEQRQGIRPPRYNHPRLGGGVEEVTVRNYLNLSQNVTRLPARDHATATADREDDTPARARDDATANAPSRPDVSRSCRRSRAAEPEPSRSRSRSSSTPPIANTHSPIQPQPLGPANVSRPKQRGSSEARSRVCLQADVGRRGEHFSRGRPRRLAHHAGRAQWLAMGHRSEAARNAGRVWRSTEETTGKRNLNRWRDPAANSTARLMAAARATDEEDVALGHGRARGLGPMERRQANWPPRYNHPHGGGGVEEPTVRNHFNFTQNVARLPARDHFPRNGRPRGRHFGSHSRRRSS